MYSAMCGMVAPAGLVVAVVLPVEPDTPAVGSEAAGAAAFCVFEGRAVLSGRLMEDTSLAAAGGRGGALKSSENVAWLDVGEFGGESGRELPNNFNMSASSLGSHELSVVSASVAGVVGSSVSVPSPR